LALLLPGSFEATGSGEGERGCSSPSFAHSPPFQYDVAPDGQRFLFLRSVVNQSEPLTLVQNWTNAIAAK
jgi:hypothetical protein